MTQSVCLSASCGPCKTVLMRLGSSHLVHIFPMIKERSLFVKVNTYMSNGTKKWSGTVRVIFYQRMVNVSLIASVLHWVGVSLKYECCSCCIKRNCHLCPIYWSCLLYTENYNAIKQEMLITNETLVNMRIGCENLSQALILKQPVYTLASYV